MTTCVKILDYQLIDPFVDLAHEPPYFLYLSKPFIIIVTRY